MTEELKPDKKKKPLLKRIGKILLIIIGSVIGLFLLLLILIQTPPVQDFARKKVQQFVSSKIDTRFEIGKIFIGLPKNIVLDRVYLEDQQQDTLLYGGKIKVDISLLKLISGDIELNNIELENLTAKVKRTLPDTVFNFQYIIDAFAGTDTTTTSTDTSSSSITLKALTLDRIRLVYDDVITGNDVTLWIGHFDTDIDRFDLNTMSFDVASLNLSGVRAHVFQSKPLLEPDTPQEEVAEDSEPLNLNLGLGPVDLEDIKVDYRNNVSDLFANLNLGELALRTKKIDLANQVIELEKIELNDTYSGIRMGKTTGSAVVEEEVEQEATEVVEEKAWKIYVDGIALNNNSLKFDDDKTPPAGRGMDFGHLDAQQVSFHIDDFVFAGDSISGKITKGEMREKSGFVLNTLKTDFLYSANRAYLKDLLIETPGTRITRGVDLQYTSLDDLTKNPDAVLINLDLDQTRIALRDVLHFVPDLATQPAFSNPDDVLFVNADVNGRLSRLNINQFTASGFGDTRLNIYGTVNGLPEMDNLNGRLTIREFHTSRRDVQALMPKGALPNNITLPNRIDLRGAISGNMQAAIADLRLDTDLGAVFLDGNIRHATSPTAATYTAKLNVNNLQLGVIMQNDTLYGPLTASFAASGRGFDPKTANANLRGRINSVTYNRYTYNDILLEGALARQQATAKLNIADPNITLQLNGAADIAAESPAIKLDLAVDSIKTLPLGFTPDPLVYRGKINADFPSLDMADLRGEMLISESVLLLDGQRIVLDSFLVDAGRSDSGNYVRVQSEFLTARLNGTYNLAQLGTVFQDAIQPYFALMPQQQADSLDYYDFTIRAQLIESPVLKAFLPDLERLDPINLNASFARSEGWSATATAPLVIMGENRISDFALDAGTTSNNSVELLALIGEVNAGGMNIFKTRLSGTLADNNLNFGLNIKDRADKDRFRLGGRVNQPDPQVYTISLSPDSLLLNYDKWTVPSDNLVKLDAGDINIRNLALEFENQVLSVNSASAAANSPLNVNFDNFRIGTLTAVMNPDTLIADGIINGEAIISNLPTRPVFTSDLNITDLMLREDTVGNLALKVNNRVENTFEADIDLSGRGNELGINGTYRILPEGDGVMDLVMDIQRLPMRTVEALSMKALTRTEGYLDGRFAIRGSFDKPDVNGELNFNDTRFNPAMLGADFRADNQTISVNNQGIRFNSFTVLDSASNELVVSGIARTTNFMNYNFDMGLTADNFMALNSTKQNNDLFYGRLFFDTDLKISGSESAPVVNGNLKINDNTNFTIVLPSSEPGVASREGIVNFVDMDSVKVDTVLSLASFDSLNSTDFRGMELAMNIEVDREAVFSVIIDEGNGDFLEVSGLAQLSAVMDQSGKLSLTGTYEVEKGAYELSFNFLRRRFEIQKGGKITWLGEPTEASIDLTAVYEANTAPLSLVENQTTHTNKNLYKQKLPFQVMLQLGGELLQPEVSFDIELPEEDNFNIDQQVVTDVEVRLNQLRSEPSEMNKQVFALLLLGRFVSENPFESSGDGLNMETVARQSVSKILTQELNKLTDDLIAGVDINFDVLSSEDYSTGQMQNRTDLNLSLSKQLLNDRLRVTVGSNFELEGPQQSDQQSTNLAGNIAIDYLLSKDGRYMLRAYRDNEYTGVIEGYVIETGVSFIISLDYDKFKDIFRRKKLAEAEERRKKKKADRETGENTN